MKITVFAVVLLSAICANPIWAESKGRFMKSLLAKCEVLDKTSLDEERSWLEKLPVYQAQTDNGDKAIFHFNIYGEGMENSLFIVFSNRLDTAIYKGPYRKELELLMDERLMAYEGYDSIAFRLLFFDTGKFCSWVNERGHPYWQPGVQIRIEFFNKGKFDDEGLFMQHGVRIR